MRAIAITEYGDPAVLRLTDQPDPRPNPGEVLIDVTSTAVNRADLMQRQGRYPPPATKCARSWLVEATPSGSPCQPGR